MLTRTRKLLNWSYLKYKDHFPIQRGKYRVGKFLHETFGEAPYTSDGFEFELHPVSVIDEKLIRGIAHDPTVTEQLHARVKPGDCVIDAGANIGLFTLQASRLVGPAGRVYAFEPSPREFPRLIRHIEMNHCENVIPIASGLADSVSALEMKLSLLGNTGQNSFFGLPQVARTAYCHVGPLASFVSAEDLPRISLIKIDVEGSEVSILRGMEAMMPKLVRATFVVEVSAENLARANETPQAIYDFFGRHGYKPTIGPLNQDYWDEVFERA